MRTFAAVEIVAIGTELLLGDVLDGNGAWMGRVLAAAGWPVAHRAVIADDSAAIRSAIEAALQRTGAVLCSGGLGPTRDDLTRQVVADLFGRPLDLDEHWLDVLQSRFAERDLELNEGARSQAMVPRGATVFENTRGTAPGLALQDARGVVILLPGVPHELRALVRESVLPFLAATRAGPVRPVLSHLVRTTGIPESSVAQRIDDLVDGLAPLSLAFLPTADGVDLRLTSWGLDRDDADARFRDAEARLRERLGAAVYATGNADLASAVGRELRARGLTLAVAESCTGGLLAARLTETSGASAFFLEGFVTYSNEAKVRALGVRPDTLERHGAVSAATAREMALGACTAGRADCAMAITGIAGPEGGSADKPVGTVFVAAAVGQRVEVRPQLFLGDRAEIRARSVQAALTLLRELLLGSSAG